VRKRLRIALVAIGILAIPLIAAPTIASAATSAPQAAPQAAAPKAGPSAAQLLARASRGCTTVSKGKPFQADSTHYFVIPLPSSRFSYKSNGIKPGSVAAVIFNNKVVYAVFADEGPNAIIGEASYATAKALGINPDPSNGGVDSGVTYIVFPGQVPSPVENNTAIDAKGAAAANAWVNS